MFDTLKQLSLPNPPELFPTTMNFIRVVFFLLCKPFFQITSEMLNGVQVMRLCRPHHSPKILFPQPFLDLFGGVLGVIIL